MQFKYKRAYGLPLYICTNEPELCGFMTNAYQAGKLCVQKCDKCRDGYLIVKPGRDKSFFLGCTNYKRNGTGCNNTLSKIDYYKQMGFEFDEEIESQIEKVTTFRGEYESYRKEPERRTDEKFEIQKATIKAVNYKGYDLNDVVFNVLCILQSISNKRFYGMDILCAILHGDTSEKVMKDKLDAVNGFGIYKSISIVEIKAIIEWLISGHYILVTKEQYPLLHSTYEGLHYSDTMNYSKLQKLKKMLEEEMTIWNNLI